MRGNEVIVARLSTFIYNYFYECLNELLAGITVGCVLADVIDVTLSMSFSAIVNNVIGCA